MHILTNNIIIITQSKKVAISSDLFFIRSFNSSLNNTNKNITEQQKIGLLSERSLIKLNKHIDFIS